MIVRCLYASRMTKTNPAAARKAILDASRKNNGKLGITGVLISAGDAFIQVLEGGRPQVSQLYNTIVQDKRHSGVTLFAFEEIAHREFEGWSMGEIATDQVNPALLLKYSATTRLDPFAMSGSAMLALMHELVATGSVVCGGNRR
ncbi:BLUF domain-containing protein [Aestuariivirga litoralis]|nr:BLUF domain-containing protein [Aestuariivirga litoralis]